MYKQNLKQNLNQQDEESNERLTQFQSPQFNNNYNSSLREPERNQDNQNRYQNRSKYISRQNQNQKHEENNNHYDSYEQQYPDFGFNNKYKQDKNNYHYDSYNHQNQEQGFYKKNINDNNNNHYDSYKPQNYEQGFYKKNIHENNNNNYDSYKHQNQEQGFQSQGKSYDKHYQHQNFIENPGQGQRTLQFKQPEIKTIEAQFNNYEQKNQAQKKSQITQYQFQTNFPCLNYYDDIKKIKEQFKALKDVNSFNIKLQTNDIVKLIRPNGLQNLHKAIKYGVWTSLGMKNIDLKECWNLAQKQSGKVYLLFLPLSYDKIIGIARMDDQFKSHKHFKYWDRENKYFGLCSISWVFLKNIQQEDIDIQDSYGNQYNLKDLKDGTLLSYEDGKTVFQKFAATTQYSSILEEFQSFDILEDKMRIQRMDNNAFEEEFKRKVQEFEIQFQYQQNSTLFYNEQY